MLLATILGLTLGVLSARKPGGFADRFALGIAYLGISFPVYWVGLLLILLFAVTLRWLPPSGYGSLRFLALPALALGMRSIAFLARMTRSAMLEVMQEDYIRTARAKGLIRKLIINRHALKNAMLPVVTLIGIEFAFLIGGLVVTEQVFNLNGVGRLFVQAVQNQDYTLTQALVMLTVMVFVICNLLVDLFYAWLDPRIRYS